jgi:hypothetical protein
MWRMMQIDTPDDLVFATRASAGTGFARPQLAGRKPGSD